MMIYETLRARLALIDQKVDLTTLDSYDPQPRLSRSPSPVDGSHAAHAYEPSLSFDEETGLLLVVFPREASTTSVNAFARTLEDALGREIRLQCARSTRSGCVECQFLYTPGSSWQSPTRSIDLAFLRKLAP